MTTRMLSALALVLLLPCAAAGSPQARAQGYPAKAVRVVVPLPAGGATDVIARAVCQRLSEMWGQQIVIENKGGANTQIGAEAVAKSAPDGYTLLATSEATLAVNPFLYRKLAYEAKDFVPVSGLGAITQALVVHPSVPANTVAEFIALAKSKPGELNYGTLGIGSSSHLNTISFESMAGVRLTAGPYRRGAPPPPPVEGAPAQGAWGRRRKARAAVSRTADHRGKRFARLSGGVLVRAVCARGDTCRDRAQYQRRCAAHPLRSDIRGEVPHAELLRADPRSR